MSQITIEEIHKLARLASLKLDEETAKRMQKEITAILETVQKLNQVDTQDVEPTYQVTGLINVTREDDQIDYGVTPEQLLALASDQKDNSIKTPKVL